MLKINEFLNLKSKYKVKICLKIKLNIVTMVQVCNQVLYEYLVSLLHFKFPKFYQMDLALYPVGRKKNKKKDLTALAHTRSVNIKQ